MHSRVLFIDIETVPDREILPADFAGDAFPAKPIQHRVVAISFLACSLLREGPSERYAVEECRSGGDQGATEEQLLRGFWQKFERDKPRVITWNGRGFDVPVLVQRAFVYGIPVSYWHQAGDRWTGYRHRYAVESHCDLMDALAEHGASKQLKLEEAALALGLPGKIGGHGSEVRDMVAAGNIAAVRAYCESDVLNLFVLYVRWAFITGRIDISANNSALESLVGYLEIERQTRPHLGQFLDQWRGSQRPAAMMIRSASGAAEKVAAPPAADHLRSEDVLP
jgi:predicted PolB exonuclease-like 3'-5' exonuclease